jgi:hypothetical protein
MTLPAMLFWLLVAHSLCDYPLQGEYLAAAKRKNSGHATPWWIALSAHAFIHAGAVALVTGSILLGVCELVLHWSIDYAKCAGKFGFTTDQVFHVACKFLWVGLPALASL